jgi:hypothetical protein
MSQRFLVGTWQTLAPATSLLTAFPTTAYSKSMRTPGRGQSDDILIRSSVSGTQRTWKGTGNFSMTDVDVQIRKFPAAALPLKILVASGTDRPRTTSAGVSRCWTAHSRNTAVTAGI